MEKLNIYPEFESAVSHLSRLLLQWQSFTSFAEREMNKAEARRRYDQENRLMGMGFSSAQAEALRGISQTLTRWCEAECNGEIERSDSGRAERVYYATTGERRAYAIPDRESGALRRLRAILAGTDWTYFYQTDPRGCAMYLIPVTETENVKSRYSDIGIAVY